MPELLVTPISDPLATYRRIISFTSVRRDAATQFTDQFLAYAFSNPGSNANAGECAFWLDPADFPVAPKTLYVRLRLIVATNGTAPGVNFTLNLYSVGSSGIAANVNLSPGASAASVTITTPALNSIVKGDSADVAFPAAGAYAFAVSSSGGMAANSSIFLTSALDWRAV